MREGNRQKIKDRKCSEMRVAWPLTHKFLDMPLALTTLGIRTASGW